MVDDPLRPPVDTANLTPDTLVTALHERQLFASTLHVSTYNIFTKDVSHRSISCPNPYADLNLPMYTTFALTIPFLDPPLQLTPQRIPLILLDQHLAIRIWIDSQRIQRVQLASPMEQVLINLAVEATKTAIELPIRELPRID